MAQSMQQPHQPQHGTPPLHSPAGLARQGSYGGAVAASSMAPAPSIMSHGSSALPQPGGQQQTVESSANPSPPPHMQARPPMRVCV